MRIFSGTNNQKNHYHAIGGLIVRCGIACSLLLICLTMSHVNLSVAQQASRPQAEKPLVRFDGRNVLFLGLSERKDVLPSENIDGYYIVSLPCRNTDSKTPRYYRFAVAGTTPLERDLFNDSNDGTWKRWDIISAALVAEGLTDQRRVEAYRSKIASVVAQISPSRQTVDKQLVQSVFETLHRRVLTGQYNVACTNLAQAIDSGDFNCVSATVLFHAMAQQAGFDVYGLEMRGHALSRVRIDQQVIDLETTCADWFNLSDQERVGSGDRATTGYDSRHFAARRNMQSLSPNTLSQNAASSNAVDPADQAPMLLPGEVPTNLREISDVQLIATIYYNRGVDELTAGRFSEATAANIKALHLDPDNENAWRNLMATFNNWAIALASKNDYLNAAQLLDEGRLIDNDYDLFQANQVHTYYHWIIDVADRRDYDTAMTLFRLAEDRLPNQPNLRFLNYTIRRKMANEFFRSQDDRKAFEQFDVAAKIAPPDVNVLEAEVVDVTQHVRQLLGENRHSRAIWLIDRELARRVTTSNIPGANEAASTRHSTARPAEVSSGESVDHSQFAVQLPDAPEVSPLFSSPVILDEQPEGTRPLVVTPRRPITSESHASTQGSMQPHTAGKSPDRQGVPVIVSPIPETLPMTSRPNNGRTNEDIANDSSSVIRPELLTQLQNIRADAVVAWAEEPLTKRDYPEAIRRLTIGEPPRDLMSREQLERTRQTYRDWAAALQAENRPDDARAVLDMAARSPYMQ